MFPLALIPIGLYALIATVSTESAIENEVKTSFDQEQKVTLKESITPSGVMESAKPAKSSTPALASSTGLTGPVVKAAIAKALQMQTEQNPHQLVQKSIASDNSQNSVKNPGQYFPITETDDGGYSAPLGLKDESHNDWMK